jgi:UDP-glucuronate decarboxylase
MADAKGLTAPASSASRRSLIIDCTDSAITHEPLPPQVRQPDIVKPQSGLEWEPDVSLEAGLRESIAYFETVI